MNTTTWTTTGIDAPAGIFGLGGADVRRCTELDARMGIGVSPAPRVAPFQGTRAPARAVLDGSVLAGGTPFAHNSIGTTLGIPPSRRPQS